jgi:predicted dehydrogenase
MSARRYRAVVVGCGRIGSSFSAEAKTPGVHSHAQAYSEHAHTRLVGLSDTDSGRMAAAQERWGGETDADPVRLCTRLAPDIISVCVPDQAHCDLASRLLEECPPALLFMEKPLGERTDEAVRMLELAERVGTRVAVNYSRRYSPAFRALRDELRSGQHGAPLLVRGVYGKGLRHNGGHALDLLRFWFGDPVQATGTPAGWGPVGDESYAVDLSWAGGLRGRLDVFDERVATVFELDCLTETSRWRFWLGGSQWEFASVQDSPLYRGYRNFVPTARERTDSRFHHPLSQCLLEAVDNVVAHLERGSELLCSGADGLAVLELTDQIARSAWSAV